MASQIEPNIEWLLDYEMRLSVRHRRFVSLVMVDADKPLEMLEQVLSDSLRSSDVCFPENGGISIVMCETGSEEALRAIERFNRDTNGVIGMHYSVASFPTDAKTQTELTYVAQQRLRKAKRLETGSVVAEG